MTKSQKKGSKQERQMNQHLLKKKGADKEAKERSKARQKDEPAFMKKAMAKS